MAKDVNGNPLAVNDWVEYKDEFSHRFDNPTVLRGQINRIIHRDDAPDWLYVDWVNSELTAPVAANNCTLIHGY
jgi:hypothetical protein